MAPWEFEKMVEEKRRNTFFGEGNIERVSNKYFRFKHYLDDNNVIVSTNNIKVIKNNYVLIVDNNKAVYLKDWLVRQAHFWISEEGFGENCHLVKLSRNFFKAYTFKSDFDGFCFDKEETFDDFVAMAKEQDEANIKFAHGYF